MPFRKVHYRFVEGMTNRAVVWYEKDFYNVMHGNSHSNAHPEVGTHISIVKQAIESPNEVRKDKREGKRYCYYAWFPANKDYPAMHMKVVLAEAWYGSLEVVTAYFLDKIPTKETIIWPKP